MTTTAQQARDEAIDQAKRHAPGEWMTDARRCVIALALTQRLFSADDVWQVIGQPPEPRALGAVMVQVATAALIAPTGDYTASVRPRCHARPIRVWAATPSALGEDRAPTQTLATLRTKYAA